jgi:hypothetical protein
MTIKPLYPSVRPSLNLNFAKTKRLDPRITFSRSSTATYIGSDGLIKSAAVNEARFDHNPATGESLGLLVEEARTNQVTYSEQFDNAAWAKDNCTVTANAVAASDNTTTADKIVSANSTAFTGVSVAVAGSTAATYTFSVFAKAAEATRIQLLWNSGVSSNYANFNLSTGAVTAGTYANAAITAFANGWYKCSITSSTTGIWAYVSLSNSDTATRAAAYPGNGTSGVYLWGAQVEAGSFPTSYIPTTTATVTRAADVASMTGTNFSSWNNPTTGTFVSNFCAQGPATFSINGAGGSSDRLIFIEASGVRIRQQLCTAGPAVYDQTPTTVYSKTASNEFAFALASGSQASALNGTIGGAGTATSIFTPTSMQIGRETAFGNYLNGSLARLAYYPVRLPNAQLQALTS